MQAKAKAGLSRRKLQRFLALRGTYQAAPSPPPAAAVTDCSIAAIANGARRLQRERARNAEARRQRNMPLMYMRTTGKCGAVADQRYLQCS
ncbi:hypothetical protein DVH05_025410 [Phytophthora capsici]|nr:hypothetical protein DVH05_002151 [Phytophthora capsici]KAG1692445.1 hypothetical protein DVH05_025410 [Phytophthora capsici]